MTESLYNLENIKEDIKTAIIDRGVTPTGGLITYAECIYEIDNNILPYYQNLSFRRSYNIAPYNYKNYTNLDYLFFEYRGKSATLLGTKNLISMCHIFRGSNVKKIEIYNTSNVTDMSEAFSGCQVLKYITPLDTSNVTNMTGIFYHCSSLSELPINNTSKVTSFSAAFYRTAIKNAPYIDTSNATNVFAIFSQCPNLQYVPKLNFGNVKSAYLAFETNHNLTELDGFTDLGKNPDLNCNNMFAYSENITRQSCINIFNNLYDRAAAGYTIKELKFEPEVITRLNDEDIAIATNKGWIIS